MPTSIFNTRPDRLILQWPTAGCRTVVVFDFNEFIKTMTRSLGDAIAPKAPPIEQIRLRLFVSKCLIATALELVSQAQDAPLRSDEGDST